MKRAFLLVAVVLFATPALAYDPREAYEAISDLTPACTEGSSEVTGKLSGKERLDACIQVIKIQQELSANGYCVKNGEWAPCQ